MRVRVVGVENVDGGDSGSVRRPERAEITTPPTELAGIAVVPYLEDPAADIAHHVIRASGMARQELIDVVPVDRRSPLTPEPPADRLEPAEASEADETDWG